MNQDRRKDENRPTEQLVFTDEKLIAAAQEHLRAERTEGCLLAIPDTVPALHVAVGPAAWIAKHTASQSQAVPSELLLGAIARGWCAPVNAKKIMDVDLVQAIANEVAPLFSHSAATGKVPEGWKLVPFEPTEDMITAGFESWPDAFFDKPEDWEAFQAMTGCQQAAHKARMCYGAMLAASPAAPLAGKAEPTFFKSQHKMIERAIIGLRDGWATRKDADDAITALAAFAPLAAAVPAEEASDAPFPERDPNVPAEQQGLFRKFDVRRVDGSDQPGGKHHGCRYYVLDLTHDQHAPAAMRAYAASCRVTHPQLAVDIEAEFGTPAEPAPIQWPVDTIQSSALTDERIRELASEVYLMDYQDDSDGYDIAIARIIEREVLAHIDRHIAAQATAGRDAVIEECAQRVEQRAANIGPIELIGEACHETATNVIANVAAAVRALKLPEPAAPHAAEQTSGGAK